MKIVLLMIVVVSRSVAQDSLQVTGDIQEPDGFTGRRVVATGLVGGILVGSLVSSYFDWWKDSAEPFHVVREGVFSDYSLGIDKIGHAYTSYFYFNTFRNIMLWGGYDRSTAFWWAAGTTAFFALSVEIGDGVSPFGFSFEDLGFNLGGLGYGMLQSAIPFLNNFNFKWSYVPTDGYRWPPRFTDHYDGHTYWLSLRMHELLPSPLDEYWPDFLQLAVGYGVGDNQTKREAVIGLDFNLEIFPVHNPELQLLQKTVNMIHLPAPAVKFTEEKKPKYYLFHTN